MLESSALCGRQDRGRPARRAAELARARAELDPAAAALFDRDRRRLRGDGVALRALDVRPHLARQRARGDARCAPRDHRTASRGALRDRRPDASSGRAAPGRGVPPACSSGVCSTWSSESTSCSTTGSSPSRSSPTCWQRRTSSSRRTRAASRALRARSRSRSQRVAPSSRPRTGTRATCSPPAPGTLVGFGDAEALGAAVCA